MTPQNHDFIFNLINFIDQNQSPMPNSSQLLLIAILVIPALALFNRPFSNSTCQPFLQTGTNIIIKIPVGTFCNSWDGATTSIRFAKVQSNLDYEILLSLDGLRQINSIIRYMKHTFSKSSTSVNIRWRAYYYPYVCDINYLSYRYIVKRSQLSHLYFQTNIICPNGSVYTLNTDPKDQITPGPCTVLTTSQNVNIQKIFPIQHSLNILYSSSYRIKAMISTIFYDIFGGAQVSSQIQAGLLGTTSINIIITYVLSLPGINLRGVGVNFIIYSNQQLEKDYPSLRFQSGSFIAVLPLYGTTQVFRKMNAKIKPSNTFYGISAFSNINLGIEIELNVSLGYIEALVNSTSSFYNYKIEYLIEYYIITLCQYCTPLYTRDEGLCYDKCPLGYYGNVVAQQCIKCNLNCLSCDSSTCFLCSVGRPLQNGCTTVYACTSVMASYTAVNSNCLTCNLFYGFKINSTGRTCYCQPGYRITNGLCHNIVGCLVPVLSSNQPVCFICNSYDHFQITSSDTCVCTPGYYLNSALGLCQQVCGDGLLFGLQCDDGNNEDGDGCSSTCQVEAYFRCFNGSQISQSNCLYASYYSLNLILHRMYKTQASNSGIFIFRFAPFSKLLKKAVITGLNLSLTGLQAYSWSFVNSQLIIQIKFNETIEGRYAKLNFYLQDFNRNRMNFSSQLSIVSNNERLTFYSSYQFVQKLKICYPVMSLTIIIIFLMASFNHKMAGVQMINTYQLIFQAFMNETKITTFYSVFKYLTYLNMNFAYLWNQQNNLQSLNNIPEYHPSNQDYSAFIFFSIAAASVALIIIALVINKITPTLRFRSKVYNLIMFPLAMASLYQTHFMYYHSQQLTFSHELTFIILSVVSNVFVGLMIFSQLRLLFMRKIYGEEKVFSIRMHRCNKHYISIYIICYYLILFYLALSRIYPFSFHRQILFACVLVLWIWFWKVLPYKSRIHNITQIVNMALLVVFLGYNIARNRVDQAINKESNELFSLFVFTLMVLGNLITNLIRIIYMIRKWCKDCFYPKKKLIKSLQKDQNQMMKNNEKIAFQQYFEHFGKPIFERSREETFMANLQQKLNSQHQIKKLALQQPMISKKKAYLLRKRQECKAIIEENEEYNQEQ